MKVQDVKKECTAKVGVQVELSNSEIDAIRELLFKFDQAVDKSIEQAKSIAKASERQYKINEDIPVGIDLRSAMRIQYILNLFNTYERSYFFNPTDVDYERCLMDINDIPSVKNKNEEVVF